MSLNIVNGDLFEYAKAPCIIVHGCNARGVMGSGFAKLIKDKYPLAYQDYRDQHNSSGLKLGTNVLTRYEDGTVIISAITQKNFGRDGKQYVDYLAVECCMKLTAMFAKSANLPVLFPLIGGGLGGGDKDHLIKIFKACFDSEIFESVNATLFLN